LKFYGPNDKPERFHQIIQSWDTANKDTELSDYSVCTTWGIMRLHLYLLDVFRRKLDFPSLKRAVLDQARLHKARLVLVEDKASGTRLIQELRAGHFSIVKEAPAMDGDKIMRLHSQTAKIEGGFVPFPKEAPWLDTYLAELTSFPNSRSIPLSLRWLGAPHQDDLDITSTQIGGKSRPDATSPQLPVLARRRVIRSAVGREMTAPLVQGDSAEAGRPVVACGPLRAH
jgi:predicted phage terminase large subunit-like protein